MTIFKIIIGEHGIFGLNIFDMDNPMSISDDIHDTFDGNFQLQVL